MLFLLNYLFCNGLNPSKAPSYVTTNSNPTYIELHEYYKNFIINFSQYFKYIDTNNEPIYLFSKNKYGEAFYSPIKYFKKYIFFHLNLFAFFEEDEIIKNEKLSRLNELLIKLEELLKMSNNDLFFVEFDKNSYCHPLQLNSYQFYGTLKIFYEILEVCDIYKHSNQKFFQNISELKQTLIDENLSVEKENIKDIPEINNIQNFDRKIYSHEDLHEYYKNFILHFSQYFRHTHIDPSHLFSTNEDYKTKESLVYYFEQCIYLHLNFFEKDEAIKNEKLSKLKKLFEGFKESLNPIKNNILWMLFFPERKMQTTSCSGYAWLRDDHIYLPVEHLKLLREILEVCEFYENSNIETFNIMPEFVRTKNIEKFILKYSENTNNLSIDLMLSCNESPKDSQKIIKKHVPLFLKKIQQIFQINDIDINASNNEDTNKIFLKLANLYLPCAKKELPSDVVNVGTAYNLLNDLFQFNDITQRDFVKKFTLLQINPFNILVNYFVWIIEQKKQVIGEFYSHDDLVLTFENFLLKGSMSIDDVLKKSLFEEQELSKINGTDTVVLFEK